jgi:hypothetical protein
MARNSSASVSNQIKNGAGVLGCTPPAPINTSAEPNELINKGGKAKAPVETLQQQNNLSSKS